MSELTRSQRELLTVIGHSGPSWRAYARDAHPKHQPSIRLFRALGLITYSADDQELRITEAGRNALASTTASVTQPD